MRHREHIRRVLDYIEENLRNEIRHEVLADVAGYSPYHFLRIFRETVHMTPGDYIRKRRITEIVRAMATAKRPICDIAFEYGFNSKENFTRAFLREHHIRPSEFKTARNSLKLYDRLNFGAENFEVKGEVITLAPFHLMAYPSDEPFPPCFWNKYNAKNWSKKLSGGSVVMDYGACIWNREENQLDYYIGIREENAKGDCAGAVKLLIPGGVYAVFDTPPATNFDFVNTIHQTWDYIARVWLKENGYRRTGGYEFETYMEESRTFSEKIYIPITKERSERL